MVNYLQPEVSSSKFDDFDVLGSLRNKDPDKLDTEKSHNDINDRPEDANQNIPHLEHENEDCTKNSLAEELCFKEVAEKVPTNWPVFDSDDLELLEKNMLYERLRAGVDLGLPDDIIVYINEILDNGFLLHQSKYERLMRGLLAVIRFDRIAESSTSNILQEFDSTYLQSLEKEIPNGIDERTSSLLEDLDSAYFESFEKNVYDNWTSEVALSLTDDEIIFKEGEVEKQFLAQHPHYEEIRRDFLVDIRSEKTREEYVVDYLEDLDFARLEPFEVDLYDRVTFAIYSGISDEQIISSDEVIDRMFLDQQPEYQQIIRRFLTTIRNAQTISEDSSQSENSKFSAEAALCYSDHQLNYSNQSVNKHSLQQMPECVKLIRNLFSTINLRYKSIKETTKKIRNLWINKARELIERFYCCFVKKYVTDDYEEKAIDCSGVDNEETFVQSCTVETAKVYQQTGKHQELEARITKELLDERLPTIQNINRVDETRDFVEDVTGKRILREVKQERFQACEFIPAKETCYKSQQPLTEAVLPETNNNISLKEIDVKCEQTKNMKGIDVYLNCVPDSIKPRTQEDNSKTEEVVNNEECKDLAPHTTTVTSSETLFQTPVYYYKIVVFI